MVVVVIQALFVAVGLIDALVTSALGWRYLLSPKFRAQVRARSTSRSRSARAVQITGYVVFFIIGNALALLILVYVYETGAWLYDGIVAPRLAHGG